MRQLKKHQAQTIILHLSSTPQITKFVYSLKVLLGKQNKNHVESWKILNKLINIPARSIFLDLLRLLLLSEKKSNLFDYFWIHNVQANRMTSNHTFRFLLVVVLRILHQIDLFAFSYSYYIIQNLGHIVLTYERS